MPTKWRGIRWYSWAENQKRCVWVWLLKWKGLEALEQAQICATPRATKKTDPFRSVEIPLGDSFEKPKAKFGLSFHQIIGRNQKIKRRGESLAKRPGKTK